MVENHFYKSNENHESKQEPSHDIDTALNLDSSLRPNHGWVSWLRFAAWIEFIGGIIIAVIIFKYFGTIRVPKEGLIGLTEAVPNWSGICAGIGIILASFFILAFLNVICLMADHFFNIEVYNTKIFNELSVLKANLEKAHFIDKQGSGIV